MHPKWQPFFPESMLKLVSEFAGCVVMFYIVNIFLKASEDFFTNVFTS